MHKTFGKPRSPRTPRCPHLVSIPAAVHPIRVLFIVYRRGTFVFYGIKRQSGQLPRTAKTINKQLLRHRPPSALNLGLTHQPASPAAAAAAAVPFHQLPQPPLLLPCSTPHFSWLASGIAQTSYAFWAKLCPDFSVAASSL